VCLRKHAQLHIGRGCTVPSAADSTTAAYADEVHLRPYLPLATCAPRPVGVLGPRVSGAALVARRPIADGEEVLLDYRLSPHHPRPAWYVPQDELAEARRWS
jgi:hypothetical protein